MKFLIGVVCVSALLAAGGVQARGESGQVRLCRDANTPVGPDARGTLVLDGVVRFTTARTLKEEREKRDEMQVVTEIIDPIRPGPQCWVQDAWVAENLSNEPLPKAGMTWRAYAFVDYDRLVDVPPKVIGNLGRVTRVGFTPNRGWDNGRVAFSVTALEDFKPMPRVTMAPVAVGKP